MELVEIQLTARLVNKIGNAIKLRLLILVFCSSLNLTNGFPEIFYDEYVLTNVQKIVNFEEEKNMYEVETCQHIRSYQHFGKFARFRTVLI